MQVWVGTQEQLRDARAANPRLFIPSPSHAGGQRGYAARPLLLARQPALAVCGARLSATRARAGGCRRLVAAALPQHDVITPAQEIGQQGALLVVPQQAAAHPPTLSMATALRLSLQAGGVQLHAVLPALQSALDFLSSQPSGSSSGGAPTAGSALS